MSHIQSRFFKECQLRSWPLKDILRGLQSAQLTKELPTNLKILIGNMSIGFSVYCIGASEDKHDKNGIQNVRDIKCLVQKFSFEPPQGESWTCWPCMDYLKKFNPKVWRTRLAFLYKLDTTPKRFGNAHCLTKNNNVKVTIMEPNVLEDVNNAIFIKLISGVIDESQDSIDTRSRYFRKNLGSVSNTIPPWPQMRNRRPGILSPRAANQEKICF
jgi:hypothetical protein